MNTKEILHINGRYRKQDCDLLDTGHVHIRIRTGKDIRSVKVVYNDPYIRIEKEKGLYWPSHTVDMEMSGQTEDYCYFSTVLPCETHRIKYYFEIYDDYECIQYSESGFTKGYDRNDLAMFFIPYLTKSNIFDPPTWIQNTVWYQILPIRFNEDIPGIIDKLDYLQELGINGLYLNPIYLAKSYHKYDVIDYCQLDPDFGTMSDFEFLCEQAHKRNMKVMLDISFTHCSDENPMFQDVLKKKKASDYYEMFKCDIDEEGNVLYETFGWIRSMPKFETESFKTSEYFINEVIKRWMELGVDAWRLDVANEISDTFLRRVNQVVHSYKKETYIVGEIWHNATEWISNTALDGVTNYGVSRAILSFVCDPNHNIFKYRSSIDELLHSYTLKQIKSSMPLLDSHDTPRLRTICDNDKDKVKFALLLLMTFYGTPSIYYGTERYMEGGGDPDNRRPTNWEDKSEDVKDIFNETKRFISLRKQYPVLANEGSMEWMEHSDLLIIRRANEEQEFFIVINKNEYEIDTYLPFDGNYKNIINQDSISNPIHMERLGYMILEREN